MITFHGKVSIPSIVIDAADEIKFLNYKTTTPAKFRKNTLTEEMASELMDEIAELINIAKSRLDYVYFSVCKGAEPHTDILDPLYFTETTFVIPVILPSGHSKITAEAFSMYVQVGGVYEFNHEKTHSMILEDTENGCVVIMVAVKH